MMYANELAESFTNYFDFLADYYKKTNTYMTNAITYSDDQKKSISWILLI